MTMVFILKLGNNYLGIFHTYKLAQESKDEYIHHRGCRRTNPAFYFDIKIYETNLVLNMNSNKLYVLVHCCESINVSRISSDLNDFRDFVNANIKQTQYDYSPGKWRYFTLLMNELIYDNELFDFI